MIGLTCHASAVSVGNVDERLTVAGAAALLGIAPASWRAVVARNERFKPDGHYDGRTPWWYRETVLAYREAHPARSA